VTPPGLCDIKYEVQQQLRGCVEVALGGSAEAESLSWSVIEPLGDGVTVGLREASEAGLLRSILSDETVGVLIGASLPRVVGCGEEEVSASGGLDALVAVELGAVVDGDGADAALGSVDERDRCTVGLRNGASPELGDHEVAGLPIDEREDAVLVGPEDGVACEVTDA